MSPDKVTLTFGSERKDEHLGVCQLKNPHSRESLAFSHMVCRQQKREGAEQTPCWSISLVIYHKTLFYMASRRAWLVVSNHFPINCSLCKSRLLGPLDARKQCCCFRFALTTCCMIELLHKKVFGKKERKKINFTFLISSSFELQRYYCKYWQL